MAGLGSTRQPTNVERSSSTPSFTASPMRASPTRQDELSPLLSHTSSAQTSTYGLSPVTPRRAHFVDNLGSRPPRNHHRIKSLRRALNTAFGHNKPLLQRTIPATPSEGLTHALEDESAYDQFTSIDWIRDNIANAKRSQQFHFRQGITGYLLTWWEDAQGWILAGIVGFLVASLAYLVNIAEASFYDIKLGYCKTRMLASSTTCCNGKEDCDEWIPWTSSPSAKTISSSWQSCLIYIAVMLLMSLLACTIVLSYKRVAPSGLVASKTLETANSQAHAPSEKTAGPRKGVILYPTAGSGVAEVKVIASGFIIHGFLGFKTLLLKAIGVTLSVASGLSVGKEGPFVHCAACIGNVMARYFPKYHTNAAKTREIISAASAAGVAVAFGAPISGVLFSLEEVSYYFPAKTLFRTFFCSIIAAVTLRFLDPYGTGKIVLFQVEYHTDWKAFEIPLFILMGAIGGALGAMFVKSTRLWARTFRRLPVISSWPMVEVAIVAVTTGLVSYWNRYTKLPVTALMLELASDCHRWEETGTGLCPQAEEVPSLLLNLATAFVAKAFLTVIAFGIKVPAGIYVPSMVVGGLLGRFLGHAVQYFLVVHTNANCSANRRLESCVIPGVYALLTAGAVMVGVTRLSITIAVMLFELSGSLNYVLPFSIAVLFARWTADAVEPMSIYHLLMETNEYPFLDSNIRPPLTDELADIIPGLHRDEVIDVSNGPTVSSEKLIAKLHAKVAAGRTDAGFPIIREGILIGMISSPDLAFCLDRLNTDEGPLGCLMSPRVKHHVFEEDEDDFDPTDFTPFVDPAPLSLDIHASTEMVYECFVKLGIRYVAATRDGNYVGLVHKKAFLKYVRNLHETS